MKIHKNKTEAIKAIKAYAKIIKKAEEDIGANFEAESQDDSGLCYFVSARHWKIIKES